MSIADKATVQLRFPVGTRVECNCGTWKDGTIVAHFYTQPDFGRGKCVPYQVRLDEGDRLIFAPNDDDVVVRRLKKKKKGRGGGAGTAAGGAGSAGSSSRPRGGPSSSRGTPGRSGSKAL